MSQARNCSTCRHEALPPECEPCASCAVDVDFGKWEAAPRPWEAPAPEPPPEVAAPASAGGYFATHADRGKLRWECLPWPAVEQVVGVLTFGANKYSAWSWPSTPDARRRYFASAIRHAVAWVKGERLDPESGLPHLAHLVCNALFLLSFELGEAAEPAALAELAAPPPAREP